MRLARESSLFLTLLAGALAGCSGSSSGSSGPSVTLSVTDAASEQLSTFVIGLDSVELVPAIGANVPILQEPTAVDFAALGSLSRVLNITDVPAGTYTGVNVVLLFDNDRVFINGDNTPATLYDADDTVNALTGTLDLPIDFSVPVDVTSGNFDIELDLDLNQSLDVDAGQNKVYLDPTLLPRVNRSVPKEHAIGGSLRSVSLSGSFFRVGLDALPGDPIPVVTVAIDAGTVFQVNGVCLLGLAGLSALDNLTAGSWVQAFGSMNTSSSTFTAATVEAGTGSYNGGSDIVEGVITDRTGGAGTDTVLTVLGHSNNSTHTVFVFNLPFDVNTSFANTKVVHRGSATLYDPDDLDVGQFVRMFGLLDTNTNPDTLDLTTATDVVRVEAVHLYGTAKETPGATTAGELRIDLARVDLRDVSLFNWADSGLNPPVPTDFVVDISNLNLAGQGISNTVPVEVVGYFSQVDASGADFVASSVQNRDFDHAPGLLMIHDRANGLTVTPTFNASSIDFAIAGPGTSFEYAVVDQGFVGQTDLEPGGTATIQKFPGLGLGLYAIRDRTLNTVKLYFTFSAFSQALNTALSGAQLFNVGALGSFDGTSTITSDLVGVVVK